MKTLRAVMFLVVALSVSIFAANAKEWDGTVVGTVVEHNHGDHTSIVIQNDAGEWHVIDAGRISEHVGQRVKAEGHFRDEDGRRTIRIVDFHVIDQDEHGHRETVIGRVVVEHHGDHKRLIIRNKEQEWEVIEAGRLWDHVGQRVRATGFVREEDGRKTIKVIEFKPLD